MEENGKKAIGLWQFVEFAAVSLLGTLLHFLYDLTENRFVALFSAVNESTWEHMKLLFFPMILFAMIEYIFVGRVYENFWCIKLRGTLLGLILIPVLFYTLRGVFGNTPDWVNITVFFVSSAWAFLYETRKFRQACDGCKRCLWAFVLLCFIAVSFGLFTFVTPQIPLFLDPLSGTYGLSP